MVFNVFAEHESVPGEMIIKLKDGVSSNFLNKKDLGIEVDRSIDLSYGVLYVVKLSGNKPEKEVWTNLQKLKDVEYIEKNYIYHLVKPVREGDITIDNIMGLAAPTDPKFNQLWGLHNTGTNAPSSFGQIGVKGADIGALKAWELSKGSKDIKVAVIDTGIDYNHPDLKDNMWINEAEANGKEGVDDDENGYIDDIHGYDFANNDGDPMDGHNHGTHCAGTIGAVHNNEIGVAGVMANVTLVAVKFLSDAGSGTSEDALKAIDYAAKVGVNVMSNSWGGGAYSQALHEAIQRASEKGIVFVAAAGNSSSNNDTTPHYPSNYEVENVISVAAHTYKDELASFSCYGKGTVDIAAPGHNILSTTKAGGYAVYSGTSMATPHVAGVVGLLLAYEGPMPHTDLVNRILKTSVPVTAYRRKVISGGRISAYNLLASIMPPRYEPDPSLWESVPLEQVFESEHPYKNAAQVSRTFTVPGVKHIRIIIEKYDLEKGYDFLKITDKDGKLIEKLDGAGDSYETDYITGDTIIAKFTSDSSITKWGFKISEIQIIRK